MARGIEGPAECHAGGGVGLGALLQEPGEEEVAFPRDIGTGEVRVAHDAGQECEGCGEGATRRPKHEGGGIPGGAGRQARSEVLQLLVEFQRRAAARSLPQHGGRERGEAWHGAVEPGAAVNDEGGLNHGHFPHRHDVETEPVREQAFLHRGQREPGCGGEGRGLRVECGHDAAGAEGGEEHRAHHGLELRMGAARSSLPSGTTEIAARGPWSQVRTTRCTSAAETPRIRSRSRWKASGAPVK